MRNAIFASIVALLTGCLAAVVAAQPVKLKFASFEPPTNISSLMWDRWVKQVNADGAGVVEIEMYWGGALGRDPRTQIEVMLNGVADIAWILPFFTPGRFPDNTVSNLPLIIQTATEGSYAIWRLYERGMLRGYDSFVPLGLFASPATVIIAVKPIPSLAGLKGLKLSAGADLQFKSLLALGAAPVSGFNFNTSAEAMSRGTIDGDLVNFTASVSFKQFEVGTHAYTMPIGPNLNLIAMNKDAYAKLPVAAKAVIDRHRGPPLVKIWAETVDAREAEVKGLWKADAKKTLVEMSGEERAQAEKLLEPVIADWAANNPNGPALVAALREEVAKVRAAR